MKTGFVTANKVHSILSFFISPRPTNTEWHWKPDCLEPHHHEAVKLGASPKCPLRKNKQVTHEIPAPRWALWEMLGATCGPVI